MVALAGLAGCGDANARRTIDVPPLPDLPATGSVHVAAGPIGTLVVSSVEHHLEGSAAPANVAALVRPDGTIDALPAPSEQPLWIWWIAPTDDGFLLGGNVCEAIAPEDAGL